MALDKITSDSITAGAVTTTLIPDLAITSAKLHTTAISDKLGYTPVSPTDLSSGLAPKADTTTVNTALALKANASALTNVENKSSATIRSEITSSNVTTALTYTPVNPASLGALATLNTVSTSTISDGAVTGAKLGSNALFLTQFNVRTSQHTLSGDSGWVDHLSITFTTGRVCNCLFLYTSSASYESGAVQGFARIILDGVQVGYNTAVAKQSTANSAGSGTCMWDRQNVSAGSHTVTIQLRNSQGATTWITPYWTVDSNTGNLLGVLFYG